MDRGIKEGGEEVRAGPPQLFVQPLEDESAKKQFFDEARGRRRENGRSASLQRSGQGQPEKGFEYIRRRHDQSQARHRRDGKGKPAPEIRRGEGSRRQSPLTHRAKSQEAAAAEKQQDAANHEKPVEYFPE